MFEKMNRRIFHKLVHEGGSMSTWDLQETHRLIREVFGKDHEKKAKESIRSITDRQAFASYHFAEVLRLTKSLETKHFSNVKTILEIHVDGAETKRAAFEKYMIKAGAHTVAAIQSLHSLPDIFSHTIYFASGQNLHTHALADADISTQKVAACIKHDINFKSLALPLSKLQSGSGWSHLAAACNMRKHRSIVRASYNEGWLGERQSKRELQVSQFSHKDKQYPSISLKDLLEPEYERLMYNIIRIANDLNICLQARLT